MYHQKGGCHVFDLEQTKNQNEYPCKLKKQINKIK